MKNRTTIRLKTTLLKASLLNCGTRLTATVILVPHYRTFVLAFSSALPCSSRLNPMNP
jgi:hypothetical protein